MPYHITDACTGCTACAMNCPVSAISGERDKIHSINEARCVNCGVCGRVCMKSAVVDNTGKLCTPVRRPAWPKPVIDRNTCSACQICVNDCGPCVLRISLPQFRGDIKVAAELFEPKRCVGCGICRDHCPIGAITMEAAV
ncbi:MAG: 4Fe-4S binding protein [Treponema sp.]|nr:4Fe-4S binding protein [Treponema sp.]